MADAEMRQRVAARVTRPAACLIGASTSTIPASPAYSLVCPSLLLPPCVLPPVAWLPACPACLPPSLPALTHGGVERGREAQRDADVEGHEGQDLAGHAVHGADERTQLAVQRHLQAGCRVCMRMCVGKNEEGMCGEGGESGNQRRVTMCACVLASSATVHGRGFLDAHHGVEGWLVTVCVCVWPGG